MKKSLIALTILISGISLNGMVKKITSNSSQNFLDTAVKYFLSSEKGQQLQIDAQIWKNGTRRQQEGLKIFNTPEDLKLIQELSNILKN